MRNRFVQPEVVRLYLVDVYRRAKQALEASPLPNTTDEQVAKAQRIDALAVLQESINEGIEDGHFVDVKKQLTAKEAHEVFNRQFQAQGIGEKALIDFEQVWQSKLVTYIVGWSLVDSDGEPVQFSAAALGHIDEETDAEIRAAVDDHVKKIDAARAEKKTNRDGASASSPTLSSGNTTAAAMTMSTT